MAVNQFRVLKYELVLPSEIYLMLDSEKKEGEILSDSDQNFIGEILYPKTYDHLNFLESNELNEIILFKINVLNYKRILSLLRVQAFIQSKIIRNVYFYLFHPFFQGMIVASIDALQG